jgi:hypothetical protein
MCGSFRYHLKRCRIKYLSIRAINVSNAVRTDKCTYSDQSVLHILRLSRQLDKGQCHTSVIPYLQTLPQILSPPFCPRFCTESPNQQHNLLSATDIFHLDRVSRIDQLPPNYPCRDNKPPLKASLSHPFTICKVVNL